MKSKEKYIGLAKWLIGTVIAFSGAGGGMVAILNYVREKNEKAEQEYIKAYNEWDKHSPESLSLGSQVIDIAAFECMDLNLGRIVNYLDSKSDFCFYWWSKGDFYGFSTQPNIEVAELGVVNFDEIRYRTLGEAQFFLPKKYPNHTPHLFGRFQKSERPPQGFVYLLKIPDHYAKVQIVRYFEKPLNPSQQWPYVRIKYDVFPIKAIPPAPKRSSFK